MIFKRFKFFQWENIQLNYFTNKHFYSFLFLQFSMLFVYFSTFNIFNIFIFLQNYIIHSPTCFAFSILFFVKFCTSSMTVILLQYGIVSSCYFFHPLFFITLSNLICFILANYVILPHTKFIIELQFIHFLLICCFKFFF